MFQTLQPQSYRINHTAIPHKRRKLHLNLQQRPSTVPFNKPLISLTPNQNLLKTIDDAQLQLTNSFRNQMSPYIKQKIRNSLSKNHQRRIFFSRTSSYLDNPQQQPSQIIKPNYYQTLNSINSTFPMNTQHFKISKILKRQTRSPFQQKQLISECIITNTKQKIDRLIDRKHQKQIKFQQLKKSIQKKCSILEKHAFRKVATLNPQFQIKPPTMQTLEWDQQWKDQTKKQSKRYRNRLIAKHKREMSMKIQIDDYTFNNA